MLADLRKQKGRDQEVLSSQTDLLRQIEFLSGQARRHKAMAMELEADFDYQVMQTQK
jgi:hypothetical protein